MSRFTDREHAGRALAEELDEYRGAEGVVVLGLPRGGVPVAAVVASALRAPLDVIVVRKVGVPTQREVAMGALASIAGRIITVRNEDVIRRLGRDSEVVFEEGAARERPELLRRERDYRAGLPPLDVEGKTVIIVDDGLATGATMRAAVAALEQSRPGQVVVAVPIGGADVVDEFSRLVDDVVCVDTPEPFWAVGQGYIDFSQTSDAEVRDLLIRHHPSSRE